MKFELVKSIISDCICRTVGFMGMKIPDSALNLLANEYTDKIMKMALEGEIERLNNK